MTSRKRRDPPVDGQRWMVTFSDLVTLMLTFFVLTLSMSSLDGGQLRNTFGRGGSATHGGTALVNLRPQSAEHTDWGGGGEEERVARAALEDAVADEIGDLGLASALDVREDGRGVVLTLKADTTFGVGDATISAAGRESLGALVAVLRRPGILIEIEGHTDATVSRSWTYRDNWELSIARAAAVARFLEDAGINPATLAVTGYGSSRPRVVGRPRDVGHFNRRVELVLKPDHPVEDIHL
jgi:chemotaxis protein MotB